MWIKNGRIEHCLFYVISSPFEETEIELSTDPQFVGFPRICATSYFNPLFYFCSEWTIGLESRTVSVFIPGKKYGEDADQQLSFPLQCNFWALANTATASKKSSKNDTTVLGSVVGLHPLFVHSI